MSKYCIDLHSKKNMLPDKIKNIFSKQGILIIIILIICFFSYNNIVDFSFIRWDDDVQITENTNVKNINLQTLNHNLVKERYTFLTLTAYSLIYKIWGNNPAPFHWLSIILHLLNVILIFILAKQFSKNFFTISLVVLLFALHPMRVESVAWISEIKDLLFTFFSIIAFLLYIKYLQNNFKFNFFLLAALMAVLASFSKIQGLLVPVSFFLFDIFYKRKISLTLILEKVFLFFIIFFIFHWFFIGLFIAVFLTIYYFRGKMISLKKTVKISLISLVTLSVFLFLVYYFFTDQSGLWSKIPEIRNTFSFLERFLLAGFALWFYISNFFFPVSLNAVHPYPLRLAGGDFPQEYYLTLIALLFIIIFSIFLIVKRKKFPELFFFGWFFFLVNISMVLHFIPIEGRLVVADRYSYLAYFGLFVFISGIGEKYLFQKQIFQKCFLPVFVLLTFMFSYTTYNRCNVWRNTKTLFTDVLKKNPDISFAYLNLASSYLINQKSDSAILYFNKSIISDSLDPTAYFNRAYAYIKIGNPEKALKDFNAVINLNPNIRYKALTYSGMGDIYQKTGNDSLAFFYYNLSVKTDSLFASAYNNRGMYFLNKNKLNESQADLFKAINLDNYYAEAYNNLGWVLTLKGELQKAMEHFNRSLELSPDYAFAYDNRGYLKFTSGDLSGAIQDYNKALKINPSLSQAYLNRGWAYAANKNYKSAVDDFTTVLKKIPNHQTALNNRAYAWFYLKEYKNADEDFTANVKFFPENANVWQALAWYHMQIKDYENSISEFEKSIELDSLLISSYINLGWIWLEKKDFQKAEPMLIKASVINPRNADALYWLGELNRRKGKMKSCCYYYNQASMLGNKQAKYAMEMYCKN